MIILTVKAGQLNYLKKELFELLMHKFCEIGRGLNFGVQYSFFLK